MVLHSYRFIVLGLLIIAAGSGTATAQSPPWELFVDDAAVSDSACDVVNTGDTELIVLLPSRELEVIGGQIVPFSYVDGEGNVFIDNFPFGFLSFAEDGDGFRTLWWLSLSDGAFRVVDLTSNLDPVATTRFPSEFFDVPCDACMLLDDPVNCGCAANVDCDDGNVCTDDLCLSSGECGYIDNNDFCNDGDACTELDSCSNGVCAGLWIDGCIDGTAPPGIIQPRISFSFCGSGATLAMTFTFLGLVTMTLIRRR